MSGTGSVGVLVLCVLLTHVPAVVSPRSPEEQDLTLTRADLQSREDGPLASPALPRPRRQRRRADYSNRDVEDFSEEEKRLLVEGHNTYRAKQGASDMMYMYWDEDLASLAKKWVAECAFKHSPKTMRRNVGDYSYVGENLYASTGTYDPVAVMKGWYDEIQYYDYRTRGCSGVCGHYTQMVWSTSYGLGCAVRYCPVLTDVSFGRGFLVSCNYGPGGNYNNRWPYQKGKSCSSCGEDIPYCYQGLCAKFPLVGADDANDTNDAMPRGQPSLIAIGCSIVMSLGVISRIAAPPFAP